MVDAAGDMSCPTQPGAPPCPAKLNKAVASSRGPGFP